MDIIKVYNRLFILTCFFLVSNFCMGQKNEIKGWSAIEYGVEISEKWKIDLSQHYRLKEDLKIIDSYITESEIFFKPTNKLILSGQLRYYRRNDNNGEIQGFENMMRYRFGVEKKITSNKLNLELRLAYQNRFSLDRDNRFKKRIRVRPMIEYKIKNWSNSPKFYFEYLRSSQGQPVHTGSWINVHKPNDASPKHVHCNSCFSGVFYLKVPESGFLFRR